MILKPKIMDATETIKELEMCNRFLSDEYKNSNYYRGYLDKVNKDLKEKTYLKT
jgi:ribonuclease HIII